ncbi:MAG: hypothetical protein ACHQDD_01705 [Steroidobacterales bacterium]
MPDALPPLEGWNNFYVIVGSSAAGLTGLTFVVIALASDANMVRLSGLRTFITPIVMHFGSALWIAALLCIPGHTVASLATCMSVTGVILAAHGGITTWRMYRNRSVYRPMLEDWIWNALLPSLCYLALLTGGVLLVSHPLPALYTIGAVALTLLFIGIHNAWDLAVWITVERPEARSQAEAGHSASGTPAGSSSSSTSSVRSGGAAGGAAAPPDAGA